MRFEMRIVIGDNKTVTAFQVWDCLTDVAIATCDDDYWAKRIVTALNTVKAVTR